MKTTDEPTPRVRDAYARQEAAISMRSTAFVKLLTKRGLAPDIAIQDENVRKASQTKKRNMYHNTLQLLKHYRDIRWMLQCFPAHVAEELDSPMEDLDALLSLISAELDMDNRKLASRLESIRKSRLMMDRLNEAVTILRERPRTGEMMYNIIYFTFIVPQHTPVEELWDKLEISCRTYYRLRQQAINIISIRLWSAPAAKLDSWIEVMTLLEVL